MKKTKIVCTLGPSSQTVDQLVAMINAGMNVARFNFSHGSHEEHLERFNAVKEARRITGKPCAILLDTKGPEIRTHDMKDGKIELVTGNTVRIAMEEVEGTAERFSVSYPELINDVTVGSRILVDDGLVSLLVTEIDTESNDIVTVVENTGIIKNKKGVNVPNVSVNLPGITEKDAADIRFGIANGIDYIAASFVRRASDVLEIVKILEEEDARHIQIIPKIENQEGVDNIDEILAVSHGLMVARGDLGVEIPTEEVPIVQKRLIKKCNAVGKPVITATQMLDSMQRNPRPTRAEAGDVANAIFDGTDAVMLSGETAAGDYPLEAVKTMASICVRTESEIQNHDIFHLKQFKHDTTEAIGRSVGHNARNLGVETIVAATQSGYTAKMISKYRPHSEIVALTFSEQTQLGLSLVWGVQAVVIDPIKATDELFERADQVAKEKGFAKEGDTIIVTAGLPIGLAGTTNMMKIQTVQ
ncbi:pyruvate kinase [Carnobacteriaceae bacterium zg-ZUI252]|nr:pyruvate kinase [Carnobacteriaceae bacterium zg-ZUI252]MBS4770516.1 pyruvate kinase [Carnobacteriaceae bacterium zg-ZUI240]QTU82564.1 pyruvate kinase [Carnobacteriaceae bacterium zg-C25]